MKKIYIHTKYRGELIIPDDIISKLPNKLILAVSIQFYDYIENIKEKLQKHDKEVILFKSKHGEYQGQILGCDILPLEQDYLKYEAFFYVGDGKFHPTALLYENKKEVYCFNPFNGNLEIMNYQVLDDVHKRKKGQMLKFLTSNNVGILVTTKSGQCRSADAEKLRDKLELIGKSVYYFLSDEVNFSQLENFNFIESWINTACPRIVQDFKSLNIDDLRELDIGF